MKRYLYIVGFFMASLLSNLSLFAQTTLFSENFDSYGNIDPLPTTGASWRNSSVVTSSWYWEIWAACSPPSAPNCLTMEDGVVDCDYVWNNDGNKIAWFGTLINASGYNSLKLNFKWKCAGQTNIDYGTAVWSTDGTTWTDVSATKYQGQSAWQTESNLDLSAANGLSFYIGFRFQNDAATGTAPGFSIDDISITGINCPIITGTTPDSRCGTGTVSLGATASAGTINWYNVSTGGSSLGTGTSFTTPSISSTTTYYVDANNGSCTSSPRTAVVATVNSIPSDPPNPTDNSPQCATVGVTITRSGSPPAGETWYWQGTSCGTNTGLGSGATYVVYSSGLYRIRSQTTAGCWSNGCGQNPVAVTVNPAPADPGNPTSNSPQCSPTAVTITRSGTPSGSDTWYWQGTSCGTSTANGSGATYSASSSGTYYIRNRSASGCWSAGCGSVAVVVNSTPSAPISNAATSITATGFTANWSASAGATTYYLDVNTNNAFTGTWILNNTNVGNVTSYSVTGLTCNTNYYYRIRAGNSCGTSGNSGTITATTSTCFNNECTSAFPLTVASSCNYIAGTSIGATQSLAPCTGDSDDDVWYSFVAISISQTIQVAGAANFDPVFEVREGSCPGTQISGSCTDAGGTGGTETFTYNNYIIGNTYYIRVWDYAAGSGDFNICVTGTIIHPSAGFVTQTIACGTTYSYTDPGGISSDYSDEDNGLITFCPSSSGQYINVNFSSFNTESSQDILYVFDGATANAPILGVYSGSGGLSGNIRATSSNNSGCLSFRFSSDVGTTYSGWEATVTCNGTPSATVPTSNPEDCQGAIVICSNSTLVGGTNNYGYNELPYLWNACLGIGNDKGENESNWYVFSSTANGTIGFEIVPNSPTDYDWAIWGPYTTFECPAFNNDGTFRCSSTELIGNGNTGCMAPATDVIEQNGEYGGGANENGFLAPMNVLGGEIYVMMLDNWDASTVNFQLTWYLSNGANLDCDIPLPVTMINLHAKCIEGKTELEWSTSSESNNDYFAIEKNDEGFHFYEIGRVSGAGNSNSTLHYSFEDPIINSKTAYYRIKQVDYNGQFKYHRVVASNCFISAFQVIHSQLSDNNMELIINAPEEENIGIFLYDIQGKLIAESKRNISFGSNKIIFNKLSVSSGIYLLNIIGSKNNYQGKLVYSK